MTFKTDNILEEFALFKDIRLLLEEYLDETGLTKIPSISELYSKNMYFEWMELASLIADSDNWTKGDWDNFVASMSMAEATKSTMESIYYALTGLRVALVKVPVYDISKRTITIEIKILDNVPYIDRMKSLLKRCLEYLLFTKDSDITIRVELLLLSAETTFSVGFTSEVNLSLFMESNSDYKNIDISQINFTVGDLVPVDSSGVTKYVINPQSQVPGDPSYSTYEVKVQPDDLITEFGSDYYDIKVSYTVPSDLPKSMLPYVTYNTSKKRLQVLNGSELPIGTEIVVHIYLECLLLSQDEIENTRKEVHVIWV